MSNSNCNALALMENYFVDSPMSNSKAPTALSLMENCTTVDSPIISNSKGITALALMEHHYTCVLKVDDLVCKLCRSKVRKELKKINGVTSVDVQKRMVVVSGDVDPATIMKTLSKLKKRAELVSYKKDHPRAQKKRRDRSIENPQNDHKAIKDTTKQFPSGTCVVRVRKRCCDEHLDKIKKKFQKIKGVNYMTIDGKKRKITVSGDINLATIIETIRKFRKVAALVSYKKNHRQHTRIKRFHHLHQTKTKLFYSGILHLQRLFSRLRSCFS